MTCTDRLRRAAITLAAALLIACAAHIAFFAMLGSGGLTASLDWTALRDLLAVGLLPSLAVFLWLAFETTPTFKKAILVTGAVTSLTFGATWVWLLSIDDALNQSYATLRLVPAIGGLACSLLAYGAGSLKR
jgi:hypothetical protein